MLVGQGEIRREGWIPELGSVEFKLILGLTDTA